jgi:uncharacterized delta-60 repeat protein
MRLLLPLSLLLTLAIALPAAAATPSLDIGFADGGRTQGPLGLKDPAPLAVQADGGVVFGLAHELARLTPQGAVDTAFGTGGRAAVPAPPGQDQTVGLVAAGPKGRIYVAGMAGVKNGPEAPDAYAGYTGYLAALKSDGSLDTAFGENGFRRFPGLRGFGAIEVDGDGNVLLAAGGDDGTVKVVRVLASGTPDPGFGTAGVASLALGRAGHTVFPRTIELLSGRRIVVAGGAEIAGRVDTDEDIDTRNYSWAIGQLKPDGTTDTSFSKDGVTRISIGAEHADRADVEEVDSIVPVGSGFVAAGSADVGFGWSGHAALARFDRDGALHRSFGSRGKVTLAPTGDGAGAVRDSAGRIVLVGSTWRSNGAAQRILLARFSTTGRPDRTLGKGGKGWTTYGFARIGWEVLPAAKERIIVEGGTNNGTVIARLKI